MIWYWKIIQKKLGKLIPYFDDLINEVTDEEIVLNDYSDDIDTEDIFSDYAIAINM